MSRFGRQAWLTGRRAKHKEATTTRQLRLIACMECLTPSNPVPGLAYSSECHYIVETTNMIKAVSAADANRRFSELLRTVKKGRSVVVTSHGKPVARISPVVEDDL